MTPLKGHSHSLKEPVEIACLDSVETPKVPIGLIPEVLHAVDVVSLIGEELGMIDAHVMEFGEVEGVVGLETVDVNNAVRGDSLFNDREQGFGSCVRHDGRKTLPTRLSKPIQSVSKIF